ncbi:uncharacterized protein LOC144072703 isoform X2 [Stigmatopora argus]
MEDFKCKEDREKLYSETVNLLSEAQLLLGTINEVIKQCAPARPSARSSKKVQWEVQSCRENGEALIIEGFRFESVVSKDDLKVRSQTDSSRKAHKDDGTGPKQGQTS